MSQAGSNEEINSFCSIDTLKIDVLKVSKTNEVISKIL